MLQLMRVEIVVAPAPPIPAPVLADVLAGVHASTVPEVVVGPGGRAIIRVSPHFSQVEN
jgi:hypothetical protein